MGKRVAEFWWLVALEAALFFSVSCWQTTASRTAPLSHASRFAVDLALAATLATAVFHLGPALSARRFGPARAKLRFAVLFWLCVGYIEWLVNLSRLAAISLGLFKTWPIDLHRWPAWIVGLAFLSVAGVFAWVRTWWKTLAVLGILLGSVILTWALSTTWSGIFTRNPFLSSPPADLDYWVINLNDPFVTGVLLSAAPAFAIALRIGEIESSFKWICLSGLAGVLLPLVLSVTAASVATEAGVNLHWRPSLPNDFSWALLGRAGRPEAAIFTLTSLTMLCPSLVSAFALRQMSTEWRANGRLKVITGATTCVIGYLVVSPDNWLDSWFHQLWARSLVILGAAGITFVAAHRARTLLCRIIASKPHA